MVKGVNMAGISNGGFRILSDFREYLAELQWMLLFLFLLEYYHIKMYNK